MARGDNKCPRCGEWAGVGHACLVVEPTTRSGPDRSHDPVTPVDNDTLTQRTVAAEEYLDDVTRWQPAADEEPSMLATLTPQEFDTKLAAIYSEHSRLVSRFDARFQYLPHLAAPRTAPRGMPRGGQRLRPADAEQQLRDHLAAGSIPDYEQKRVREALAELDQLRGDINLTRLRGQIYDGVFRERGGWPRAFLVVSSQGGHVHRDMACPTTRLQTQFHWMTEFSGQSESDIVNAAGERACTVCYPSAPVEVLHKPTRMFTPDEQQRARDRQERAAAKVKRDADKAAKAITTPDGQPLRIKPWPDSKYTEEVRTEVTARRLLTDALADLQTRYTEQETQHHNDPQWLTRNADHTKATVQLLADAIAAKHGLTADDILNDPKLAKSVQGKVKKYWNGG